jgi:hypothetical protein
MKKNLSLITLIVISFGSLNVYSQQIESRCVPTSTGSSIVYCLHQTVVKGDPTKPREALSETQVNGCYGTSNQCRKRMK